MTHKPTIGRVFILVEGEVEEIDYFTWLFKDILGYDFTWDRDRCMSLYADLEQNHAHEDNHVIVKTAPRAQLHASLQAFDDDDEIPRAYGLTDFDYSVYVIFDKDENRHDLIESYFDVYDDSTESGLRLLSYPCMQGWLLDHYEAFKVQYAEGCQCNPDLKELHGQFASKNIIDETHIAIAVDRNRNKYLEMESLESYDLDQAIANRQELDRKMEFNRLIQDRKYRIFSQLFMMFEDLQLDTYIEAKIKENR